jgi:hypothetical protein
MKSVSISLLNFVFLSLSFANTNLPEECSPVSTHYCYFDTKNNSNVIDQIRYDHACIIWTNNSFILNIDAYDQRSNNAISINNIKRYNKDLGSYEERDDYYYKRALGNWIYYSEKANNQYIITVYNSNDQSSFYKTLTCNLVSAN